MEKGERKTDGGVVASGEKNFEKEGGTERKKQSVCSTYSAISDSVVLPHYIHAFSRLPRERFL